jgi:hypothetical protein
MAANCSGKSTEYLKCNDVVSTNQDTTRTTRTNNNHNSYYSDGCFSDQNGIHVNGDNGGCSPLYRAVQTIPDNFNPQSAMLECLQVLLKAIVGNNNPTGTDTVCCGNASNGDKPLALLYRRFTRKFHLAEKFLSRDNSHPEVVKHRCNYKQAAGNTWKFIELLLQHQEQPFDVVSTQYYRIVHRAVQGETPPALLRYFFEANAEDLTTADEAGNLPLHYKS